MYHVRIEKASIWFARQTKLARALPLDPLRASPRTPPKGIFPLETLLTLAARQEGKACCLFPLARQRFGLATCQGQAAMRSATPNLDTTSWHARRIDPRCSCKGCERYRNPEGVRIRSEQGADAPPAPCGVTSPISYPARGKHRLPLCLAASVNGGAGGLLPAGGGGGNAPANPYFRGIEIKGFSTPPLWG